MNDYILKNRKAWQELEVLLAKAKGGRGLSRMRPEEISRMDALYRRTAVHLAQVSTRTQDRQLIRYLNDLTAAAHAIIYLPPKRSVFRNALGYLALGFSRAVVRNWRFMAISALLMGLGGLAGYLVALADPVATYAILPASEERHVGADPALLQKYLVSGRDAVQGEKFIFSSQLFDNNFRVSLLAASSGALACVPTIFIMLFNGMLVGVMSAAYHDAGLAWEWWAWILPHGVTELSAIILSGGVGLMLGWAIIAPGWQSRGARLRAVGREAAGIFVGVGVMLIFAAIVESFLRQSNLSNPTRHVFAAGTWIFWFMYFWNGVVQERKAKKRAAQDGEMA